MNKIIALCLFFVLVLLNSCKNDENPVSSYNNTSSDGSNIMPLNKGAWYLMSVESPNFTGTYKSTVQGEKVINGKTYAEITNDQTSDIGYNREANGALYQLLYDPVSKTYSEFKSIDLNVQNINDSWTYDRTYNGAVNRIKNYFLGKDFKYTFKGKEYSAYKYKVDTYVIYGGQEILATTSYNWVIKGIGQVYSSSSIFNAELIDYGTN